MHPASASTATISPSRRIPTSFTRFPGLNTRNALSQSSIAGVISASVASPATMRAATASRSDRRTTAVRSTTRRRDRHIMTMICGRRPMPTAF